MEEVLERLQVAAPVLPTRELLLGRRLGVPWAAALLCLTCVVVTLPVWHETRHYYLTLGTGFCDEDNPNLHWWHALVTPFLHGAGCRFPSPGLHIAINLSFFIFQGMIVERLLGAGRFGLLTFTALAVNTVLKYALVDGRAHGASGMTWSYLPFIIAVLLWRAKADGKRVFWDPVAFGMVVTTLFGIAGLIKNWHLYNLLVSIPFYFAWRGTLRANLDAAGRGEPLQLGGRAGRLAAIGVAGALLAFDAAIVGLVELHVLT